MVVGEQRLRAFLKVRVTFFAALANGLGGHVVLHQIGVRRSTGPAK